MNAFQLVAPNVSLKESHLAGLREFQNEGLPWYLDIDLSKIERDFQSYINDLTSEDHVHPDHKVRETVLWGVWNGKFAGDVSIRHELNEALRSIGGHIGYDTCPTFRGRGIATLMLKGALPIAKNLGLKKVLLTCDDTNIPSIRVLEKNGAVLEAVKQSIPGRPPKRYYWITL